MVTRTGSIALLTTLLILTPVAEVAGQTTVIPTMQHETLDFELKSLRDKVTLYFGDPQELVRMDVRPLRTVKPRVEVTSQVRGVVRIVDSFLLGERSSSSETGAEKQEGSDTPDSQEWEIRLSPAGPTSFALRCDEGQSTFDFTDFQVQRVDIDAEKTQLDIDFSASNPIVLESFNARAPGGSVLFHHMINARAKEIALFVPEAVCQFEITGKAFEGESAITVQGVPAELRLVVSRKVGLRVTGPAATTARFGAPHMARSGEDWVSQRFDGAKCRVRLTFAEDVPRLAVKWD